MTCRSGHTVHRHTLVPYPHFGQLVHAGVVACPSGQGSGISAHPSRVFRNRTTSRPYPGRE